MAEPGGQQLPIGPGVPSAARAKYAFALAFVVPIIAVVFAAQSTWSSSQLALVCSHPQGPPSVHTLDAKATVSECVVYDPKLGTVLATGGRGELQQEWAKAKVRQLGKGEVLLPGLTDSHAHVLDNGETASLAALSGASSIPEIRERIVKYLRANPDYNQTGAWVQGFGWALTDLGRFPTAADLEEDPRLKGKLIKLRRVDAHGVWVSQAVLDLLPPNVPDVEGGLVARKKDGHPEGVFLDKAEDYITAVTPEWSNFDRLLFLRSTQFTMLSLGLTGVHDASLPPSAVSFFKLADKRRQLKVRLYGMLSCVPLNSFCLPPPPAEGEEAVEGGIEQVKGKKFTLRAVKLFIDGALGSRGAALLAPYSDDPSNSGLLMDSPSAFKELVSKWVERGWQVCGHAIGDRANKVLGDAFESVLNGRAGGNAELRLRVEHAQIIAPEDIQRFGRLGVIPSMQPTHATSDASYVHSRLGPIRVKGAYAWRSLLRDQKLPLTLGSDFPVEGVSPWEGMHAAMNNAVNPGESLSAEEALRGFTTAPAYAAFEENEGGSLEAGKRADFIRVKVDDALWEQGGLEWMKKVRDVEVLGTVIDGKVEWGSLTG